LKSTKRARELVGNIEGKLVGVLEDMINRKDMKDMYDRSTELDSSVLNQCSNIRHIVKRFKDRVEIITMVMQANYSKEFVKDKILKTRVEAGA
jgi:hypothetical protein